MAEKEFYVGSLGPFFYDDEEIPSGVSGVIRRALIDDGVSVGESLGIEVVTDVSLSIDFTAETFDLTVTKTAI